MPAKLCPSCHNPVLSHATACHSCGAPLLGARAKRGIVKLIHDVVLGLAAVAIVAGGLWYFYLRQAG